MDYKVVRFKYNGLFVKSQNSIASYTAKFKNWTEDPGICRCVCSDGLERLIPSCCLVGFNRSEYPKQVYENKPMTIGIPCTS